LRGGQVRGRPGPREGFVSLQLLNLPAHAAWPAVAKEDQFRLVAGGEMLTEYLFLAPVIFSLSTILNQQTTNKSGFHPET
jgi:hypothetical protein